MTIRFTKEELKSARKRLIEEGVIPVTMRFVAKFYPNSEKEAEEARKALEEVRDALREKVAYPTEHVPVVKTTEADIHSDGANGFTTTQREVVKLDLYLHFRENAFPEPEKEGDSDA